MRWESFKLSIRENTIRGKLFSPSKIRTQSLGLVILCHGIPGGRKDPHDPGYPKLAEVLSEEGYQAVIFNFRGAGESTGDFDIIGWVEDLKGVLDYLFTIPNSPHRVALFGFSAGAAVGIYAAAHDNRVNSLLLCGCPADFDSVVSEKRANQFLEHAREVGIITTPGFPPNRFDWVKGFQDIRPEHWIGQIKSTPKLFLHGDNDEVVSVDHAFRLYEKAQEPKDLIIIKNGGHRLRLNDEAMNSALEWLKKE